MMSVPLAEVFYTKMHLKHENVFQIHKKTCKLYFNYKIQITCVKLTKYKIHEMYFNYIFQLLVFQLLYNTVHEIARCLSMQTPVHHNKLVLVVSRFMDTCTYVVTLAKKSD